MQNKEQMMFLLDGNDFDKVKVYKIWDYSVLW